MTALPGLPFDRPSILALAPREGCWVYRLYRSDGQLMYVGASIEVRQRLLAHLRTKGEVVSEVRLERFRTTTAMHRAERRALATEEPLMDCGVGRRHGSWRARRA